jgi:hypothetical protein
VTFDGYSKILLKFCWVTILHSGPIVRKEWFVGIIVLGDHYFVDQLSSRLFLQKKRALYQMHPLAINKKPPFENETLWTDNQLGQKYENTGAAGKELLFHFGET